MATAVDIADHDRQALVGVLMPVRFCGTLSVSRLRPALLRSQLGRSAFNGKSAICAHGNVMGSTIGRDLRTVPNVITLSRILLILFGAIVYFYLNHGLGIVLLLPRTGRSRNSL